MDNVSYFGVREGATAHVFRYRPERDREKGAPLDLRLDLRKHSPSGPEWGYNGSGPAQLALALLADFLQDDGAALALYQEFKVSVVGRLPHESWTLTERDLAAALVLLRPTPSAAQNPSPISAGSSRQLPQKSGSGHSL